MKEPRAAIPRDVILVEFDKGETRRINKKEAAQRMADQRARGVRITCEGVDPAVVKQQRRREQQREACRMAPLVYMFFMVGVGIGGGFAWTRPWAWVGFMAVQAVFVPACWWFIRRKR